MLKKLDLEKQRESGKSVDEYIKRELYIHEYESFNIKNNKIIIKIKNV